MTRWKIGFKRNANFAQANHNNRSTSAARRTAEGRSLSHERASEGRSALSQDFSNSPSANSAKFHAALGSGTVMHRTSVLLVGESLNQYSDLARRLTSWGGDCRFVASYKQVYALPGQQTFELVISGMNLVDGSVLRLIPLLEGTPSSLFCFHPIEDSCLWIPIVERGQICWRAPALRPSEFGRVLRRALTEECTVSVSERRMQELPAAPSPSPSPSSTNPRELAKAG